MVRAADHIWAVLGATRTATRHWAPARYVQQLSLHTMPLIAAATGWVPSVVRWGLDEPLGREKLAVEVRTLCGLGCDGRRI